MKRLPKTLTKDGFTLTQKERSGRAAIYEQSRRGMYHKSFEVVIPNVYRRDFSGECEPYESYPGSEQWGRKGWTLPSLEKAKQKLKEINEKK